MVSFLFFSITCTVLALVKLFLVIVPTHLNQFLITSLMNVHLRTIIWEMQFLIVSTILFLLYIAGSSQHKSSGAFLCQKFASETKILKHGFAYRFPQLDDHEMEKFATFDLEPLEVFLSYFKNFKWTKRRLQLCNILINLLYI